MSKPARTRILDLPCHIGGDRPATFRVYLGRPAAGFHPLYFQLAWLRESRDGEIASSIMEQLAGHPTEKH